jgi:hypothetical protein
MRPLARQPNLHYVKQVQYDPNQHGDPTKRNDAADNEYDGWPVRKYFPQQQPDLFGFEQTEFAVIEWRILKHTT